MKKYCIDCKKIIDSRSIRCKICSNIFNSLKRKKYHYCIECNKEISKSKYKRCSKCYGLSKRKIKVIKKCINCNKIITTGSKLGFCKSCAFKGKNNPMYGRKRTLIEKQKISRTIIKKGLSNGKNNPNYIDGRTLIKHKCIICNENINYDNWKKGKRRCQKCYLKDCIFKKNNPLKGKFGKNHPSYINGKGYEPYPEIFNKQFTESVRRRDNHTCQNCHKKQKEELKDLNKKLSIHHIDYDKNNCKEDNLITLCHKCNMKANYNRDFWKNLYQSKIKKII